MKRTRQITHRIFGRITGATLGALAFASVFAFAVPSAYAMRGGEGVNLSAIRHQGATRINTQVVRIEGALTCDFAENSGKGCALRIQQNGTGKIFNLVEAANAMRLFMDGSRNVAVEGTLADNETLQVKKAEML